MHATHKTEQSATPYRDEICHWYTMNLKIRHTGLPSENIKQIIKTQWIRLDYITKYNL